MSSDGTPYGGGHPEGAYGYHRRGVNTRAIIGIGVFAVLSFYAALMVSTRLDQIIAPGNELGGLFVQVPGTGGDGPDSAETIDQRINILFLGLDRRLDQPEGDPYRTDSVMVLTIDPFSKTAGAFSIPRDTFVDIPDGEGGVSQGARINEAWEIGEYFADYPGGGPQLAKDTIEYNFGIPIDHYVLMDWVDFMDIVNEIGGIDIDVPEYAYDPAYATCTYCGDIYPVEFIPGPEHMDGERALEYSRIRNSDSDYKRIERQQLVLKAMARQAASIDTIINNPIGLYNKFKGAVETDISDIRALGLAALMRKVGVETIRTVSMQPATYPCNDGCTAAWLYWDPAIVEELKAQVFSDSRVINDTASVAILNGTPTPELAGAFGQYMKGKGVPPEKITIDEYANGLLYDTTIVVDTTGGNEFTVQQISEWLGLSPDRVVLATDPQATPFLNTSASVVVVLGSDVEVINWTTGELHISPSAGG
ncbi:MAG: LCP family protein [Dehalococcoidia bacterium]